MGPDINIKGIGLLNWFMENTTGEAPVVNGFTKAKWTGQTTFQLAKTMEVAAKVRAHGGMSGGPIIDSKGQFVAIITQRTTVHFNIKDEDRIVHIDVPSGSTIGMTLNLISLILYKGSAII